MYCIQKHLELIRSALNFRQCWATGRIEHTVPVYQVYSFVKDYLWQLLFKNPNSSLIFISFFFITFSKTSEVIGNERSKLITCNNLELIYQPTYYLEYHLLCRLPFWQRHLIFAVSSKSWHALKELFFGFLTFIYFIELKFIVVENSVCHSLSFSLSLSICQLPPKG